MKLKQISSWISNQAMKDELQNSLIKSWLLEEGPITSRIKSNESFKLTLIKEQIEKVEQLEINFLGKNLGHIKIREVILYGDEQPRVFARSLIPVKTIDQGFSKLGELGTKPLGDILFEKETFKKVEVVFAKFTNSKDIFWGRKAKYLVKTLPLSVMEVFLINSNE
tara:strand:- start:7927 stop:8424 length:498 start_codon:yes stop_codon:yes gene_type:complete